jgi:hypothetical protein
VPSLFAGASGIYQETSRLLFSDHPLRTAGGDRLHLCSARSSLRYSIPAGVKLMVNAKAGAAIPRYQAARATEIGWHQFHGNSAVNSVIL